MILELKKLFAGAEESIPFDYAMDLSGTEVDNAYPFVSPIRVTGTAAAKDGFAELSVRAEYVFSIPCDRCTRQITQNCVNSFSHVLVSKLENEEDDRFVEVPDGRLDLDALVREDILLGLPTKFLCRDDCKGICPVCGRNLNDGPCGCGRQPGALGFDVLKDFIQ